MSWGLYLLITTLCWGVSYNVTPRLLAMGLSPFILISLPSIFIITMLLFFRTFLSSQLAIITSSVGSLKMLGIYFVVHVVGTISLYMGITRAPNTTSAALLEMCFPIFVALFAFLLFGENHLSLPLLIGALLIVAGSSIIFIYN